MAGHWLSICKALNRSFKQNKHQSQEKTFSLVSTLWPKHWSYAPFGMLLWQQSRHGSAKGNWSPGKEEGGLGSAEAHGWQLAFVICLGCFKASDAPSWWVFRKCWWCSTSFHRSLPKSEQDCFLSLLHPPNTIIITSVKPSRVLEVINYLLSWVSAFFTFHPTFLIPI